MLCESPVLTIFLIEYGTERPGVLPVCYRTTGCATGVLPNDRVCYGRPGDGATGRVTGVPPDDRVYYRRVTERPGVLRTTGRPGVLLACYRTSGVLTDDGVRYRCVTERPGVLPAPDEGPGVSPACYRTTGCVTERTVVLPVRTTGRATERPGVLPVCYPLPDDQTCYRHVTERQGASGVLLDDRACCRTTGCVTA